MLTSVLQWGNWGSEMSLSRLAQGHATSRSQAGRSSWRRLHAPRPPLPAAPPDEEQQPWEKRSQGDGSPPPPRAVLCAAAVGCPSPSPTPSPLSLLSPLLDRERSQRVSKECNYRRDVFCETPGRAAGKMTAGRAGRCAGWGDGLTPLLLQLLPNNGASGEMIRQQDRGQHEPAPHSVTGKGRVGGSQLPPRSLGWASTQKTEF